MSRIDFLISRLESCKLPEEREVRSLCEKVREITESEENILRVDLPVTICGDIHGQFHDLLELLKIGGKPPQTSYLFLGDYVDRGYNSVETILLLLALKVRYPDRVTLLRGNHESRSVTQAYGLYDECIRKFGGLSVWHLLTDLFDSLPIAALVDGRIFCVHGGLSPWATTLDRIRELDRVQEVPHEGAMCDLLWSDPSDSVTTWGVSQRGVGVLFGAEVVHKFNRDNGIDLICRAHQLVQEGYKKQFDGALVTVWSAPNYCYRCGNVAAILAISASGKKQFTVYEKSRQEKMPPKRVIPDYFL